MTSEETKSKIKEIVEKIVAEVDPEKVILFGSHAWGHPGPDSDIDLFIIKETDDTRVLARRIDGALAPRLMPLDLLVWRPDSVRRRLAEGDPFLKEVLARGVLLYEQ
ncbi:MAG: nucleotidyltransferase domain-containing protein [bacterium]|nr:nucleotidyltransferase domain-containing protein [bacterium]